MTKNILVLPSGTELSSGARGNALMGVQIDAAINGDGDLTPGAAVASCLDATIWTETDAALIQSGDSITLYKVDTAGTRTKQGVFVAEKPTRKSANTYAVTAYDNVSRLDKLLSPWLSTIQGSFPMTQASLVTAVAGQCGVSIANLSDLPCAGYMVSAFQADGITGRQILSWVAAANGRYITATADGDISFAWYGSEDDTAAISRQEYYQSGFTYDDFECPLIDAVQIRQSDSDVGVIYPAGVVPENALIIQGNLVLANAENEVLSQVAQVIYNQMRDITAYHPCKLSMPVQADIVLGGRISVINADGIPVVAYVMRRAVGNGKMTVECYGTPGRGSSSSVNNKTYGDIAKKMYEFSTSIDGLKSQVSDADGRVSSIEQSIDMIAEEVIGLDEAMTRVETTVDGVSTEIRSIDGKVITITQTIEGLTVTDEQGQTLIAGGMIQTDNLYLARLFSRDGTDSYVEMLDNGLNFVLGMINTIGIGYYSAQRPQPYIIFGAGTTPDTSAAGMVKKYPNGLWIGDSADRNSSEIVAGTGILVDTTTKKIYKYNNGIGVELVDTSNVIAVFA